MAINFGGSLSHFLPAFDESKRGIDAGASTYSKFNLWTKGSVSRIEDISGDQAFSNIHLGADYRINSAFLAGVMVQVDWAHESDAITGISTSGSGWVAGPYLVTKLQENLILDAQILYGKSSNKVSPFATYTDEFDTDCFSAKAQLTGYFNVSNLTISPQISGSYFVEKQEAYIGSLGVAIASQNVELGQLSAGPIFTQDVKLNDGSTLNPIFSVIGIWNFKQQGTVNINTGAVTGGGEGDLRARLDGGFSLFVVKGWSLEINGFLDGLGQSNYQYDGANAQISVSF